MATTQPTALDRPLPVFSWAMYDFANTIYSAIVVTAFFPKFMLKLTGRPFDTGLAQTVSMVVAGLLVPVAGALADRTGRAKRYLWWLTIACCALTAGIGLSANDAAYDPEGGVVAPRSAVLWALVLFGLANLTYQASLVFYNTLLPAVASPERQGRVSGFGVGLGYLGVVGALPLAMYAHGATGAMRVTFFLAAAAFFVSALPLFAFVHPPRPPQRVRVTARMVVEQFPELGRTLRAVGGLKPVLFFFIGNFLCVDVVNTLIFWVRPYLEKGVGFSETGSGYTLLGMSATAFVLGMGMGWLTDRLGAKRTLLAAAGSLLACIVVASLPLPPAAMLPVFLILGSGGLAGTWTAGRKWLLEVTPPEKVGEFFGLYGVTVKLSVLGCSLFGALAQWTGSYRTALLSLLLPLVVGIVFLTAARPVRAEAPGGKGT